MEDVSQTLFYPLLGRAKAASQWPDLFPDPWATQAAHIAAAEKTPAQPLGTFPTLCYGLRHLFTIREITQYLDTHPGAAVVNIGCGLDVLSEDLAGYDCTIYNLDFPDVIDMRHRWVPKADNEIDLPYSATDHEWLTKVSGDKGVIAVAPGVFYYLPIPEVAALVDAFGQAFPGGRLVYETESPMVMRGSEKQIARHTHLRIGVTRCGTTTSHSTSWITSPMNSGNRFHHSTESSSASSNVFAAYMW